MKRIITIGSILALIIIFSLLGILNIANVKSDFNSTLDKVSSCIQHEDFDTATDIIHQMKAFWKKENELLDTYVKHDLPDKIGMNIVKIEALLKLQSVDDLTVEIADMRYNLQHLYETELPLIGNIL